MVVVDDSIVRGTTSRKIVKMIRAPARARSHVRISSPPIQWPCYYGIDTPTRKELIGSSHSVDEIRRYLGRRLARLPLARRHAEGDRYRPGALLPRLLHRQRTASASSPSRRRSSRSSTLSRP